MADKSLHQGQDGSPNKLQCKQTEFPFQWFWALRVEMSGADDENGPDLQKYDLLL